MQLHSLGRGVNHCDVEGESMTLTVHMELYLYRVLLCWVESMYCTLRFLAMLMRSTEHRVRQAMEMVWLYCGSH